MTEKCVVFSDVLAGFLVIFVDSVVVHIHLLPSETRSTEEWTFCTGFSASKT
jgi:hypothetical protein